MCLSKKSFTWNIMLNLVSPLSADNKGLAVMDLGPTSAGETANREPEGKV